MSDIETGLVQPDDVSRRGVLAGLAAISGGLVGTSSNSAVAAENSFPGLAPSKTFGIIGGMAPPSTVHYYLELVDQFAQRKVPARLLINEADINYALSFVTSSDKQGLARYLASLINPLAQAGATFVAMAAVTPHLCLDELRPLAAIPIIDILESFRTRLHKLGAKRVGLLGNRFTMSSKAFGRLSDFDVITLEPSVIDEVHRIYFSIAANGQAAERDVTYLRELAVDLVRRQGADVVGIAGTEFSLVLHEGDLPITLIDLSKAHIEDIVEHGCA